MITDAVVEFLDVARSVSAGSCNALGQPFATRCAALRVADDRRHVTVFVAQVLSSPLLRNLAETWRMAVQVSDPASHRTLQLKGRCLRSGPADDAARDFVQRYVQELAHVVDKIGMPYERVVRMAHWPAVGVELRVEEIYLQTPGPGAGAPLAGRSP